MVIQEKKTKGEICIYVDLRKLKDACIHDPFPTPFSDEILDSVDGKDVIMPIEYVVPSLRIATFTNMAYSDIIEECLVQLVALEEDRFIS